MSQNGIVIVIYMKDLIQKAKEGNTEAFAEIFRLYYTPVYRYVLLRMGSKHQSEDIVQEVFLKAFQSMPGFDLKKVTANSMLPYLFTIARNAIIDHKKKASREIIDDEIVFNYAGVTELPSNALEKEEWGTWLFKALTELSASEREVLELKFLSELTNQEVSLIMGKTEEAVRQLQSRGIRNLRDILKRDQKRFENKIKKT